ncbi:MAG: YigZ family protein [Bifidobacterium sp.]|nr:YigZ family protein [Bifidobacterium sp.]
MTRTVLDPPSEPAHDAFVEKKSEFIGDACHVTSLDEALAFVAAVRGAHPKARHVAYAALATGPDGRLMERMSDDGEPSGTAGKPILDVLRANDLTDTAVAVTRYFGGILLGSGGLIRAYSTGASLAVKAARVAELVACRRYDVTLDYPQVGTFANLLAGVGGEQESADYTDRVRVRAVVPMDACARFETRVTEAFNAAVVPEPGDQLLRAVG